MYCFGLLPMKSRKGLACVLFDTPATHAGHVMTSLIQAAERKMAALTVVFLRF